MHRRGGGFAVVRVEQHAVGQDLDALGDALELAIERWSRVNRKAEFEHLAGRVLVDQATRRPGRDDLRLVHHDQPVAQLLGLVHVVRGQDDGHALLLEPVKAIPNQVPRLRVEAGRGLVEQEKAGLVDERTGDREPSFHATGEGLDFVFGAVLELDELEQLLRAGSRDVTRNIEVAGVGEQVFVDPEFHVERVGLGHHPQPRSDSRAVDHRIEAEHAKLATGRRRDAADHAHRRRLAGAVRSEEAERLAPLDVEVDRVDRDQFVEALGQATGMDKRVCTGSRCCHGVESIL